MKKNISLRTFTICMSLILNLCGYLPRAYAKHPAEPSISITFDDGFSGSYEYASPILAQHRIPATMYVITSAIGRSGRITYVSWDNLATMQRHGWEIGSHTHTHAHLTKIPTDEVTQELSMSKKILQAHGIDATSFALPFGEYDDTVLDIARRYYTSTRLAWDNWSDRPITGREGRNGIPLTDPFRISAVTVTTSMTVEDVKERINKAIEKKRWFVLVFHNLISKEDIAEEGDGPGEYDYPTEKFKQIIAYVAALRNEKKITPLTVRDAVSMYKR